MVDKAKSTMNRQIEDIKYQLVNIATPGHTHDEQSLQIETEKTNERIFSCIQNTTILLESNN